MKFSELLNNEFYNKGNNFKEKEGNIKFDKDGKEKEVNYDEPDYEVEKDEQTEKIEKAAKKEKESMKFNLYFNKK